MDTDDNLHYEQETNDGYKDDDMCLFITADFSCKYAINYSCCCQMDSLQVHRLRPDFKLQIFESGIQVQ